MARRNLCDNTSEANFLRNLPARPLADRASSATGGCAGQGDDLAHLFGGDPRRMSRTGRIRQALGNADVLQTDRVEAAPTLAPETDGVDVHTHAARNLGIVVACGSCQDDPCPYGELLCGRMPPGQSVQRVLFVGSQSHERWFWPTHSDRPSQMRNMNRVHDTAEPVYHRKIRAQRY